MLNIIIDSTINLTCKSDVLYTSLYTTTTSIYSINSLINQPQNCQLCIILGLKAKPINPRLVFSLAFAATETTFI